MYLLIAAVMAIVGYSMAQVMNCSNRSSQVKYEWKVLEYAVPPQYVYPIGYIPTSNFISGIEETDRGLMVATPREANIAPATLSRIPNPGQGSSTAGPILEPYPNITFNTIGSNPDCSRMMVSVQRMAKDKCNRLWVVDYGVTYNFYEPVQLCPPKFILFNLTDDTVIRIVEFPSTVVKKGSVLPTLVLDDVKASDGSTLSCDHIYAYMSDNTYPAIIVYHSNGSDSPGSFHRITHPSMYPDLINNLFIKVQNRVISFPKGILGMDLGVEGSRRLLYYQPVASYNVFTIPTSILQNPPPGINPNRLAVRKAFTKQSEGTGIYVDSTDGCVVFNPVSQGSIVGFSPSTQIQRTLVSDRALISIVEDFNQVNSSTTYAISWAIQDIITFSVDSTKVNGVLLGLLKEN